MAYDRSVITASAKNIIVVISHTVLLKFEMAKEEVKYQYLQLHPAVLQRQ